MNNYSNFDTRIRKIKETIEDIRGDLESLKIKNETKNLGSASVLETQNFNPNTTMDNKSVHTVDYQSENSVPAIGPRYQNQHNTFTNQKEGLNFSRDNNLNNYNNYQESLSENEEKSYYTQIRKKENFLGNSKSERNLHNSKLEHNRRNQNKIIDNPSVVSKKHLHDSQISYIADREINSYSRSPILNRAYSSNRIESKLDNSNYGYSRNEVVKDNSRTYSASHRHYAQPKDPFRTVQSKELSHLSYNSIIQRDRNEIIENSLLEKEKNNQSEGANKEGLKYYSRNREGNLMRNTKNERKELDSYSSKSKNSTEKYRHRKESAENDYMHKTVINREKKEEKFKKGFKIFETSKYSSHNNNNYGLNYKYNSFNNSNINRREDKKQNISHNRFLDTTNESVHNKTYASRTVSLEQQIQNLNLIVSDLKRKNEELQRQLLEKENNYDKIPFYVGRKENITLEKNENLLSEASRSSPRFQHNYSRASASKENEKFAKGSQEKDYFYQNLVRKIKDKLNVSRDEEIIGVIEELKERNNKDKLKENLLEKLQEIYRNQCPKSDPDDIREIWRWLKSVIKASMNKTEELERKIDKKAIERNEDFKNFCEKIIEEFGLKDIKELKTYMKDLALKNQKNKTRVERMKKLLLSDPVSKLSINQSQIEK